MQTRLYVGNLSYSVTEEELHTLFSQAGSVQSVKLIEDRDTGRSKGFAFVEMSSQAEAEKAINMFNGSDFSNRQLSVSIARPREERPRGGGGGGFGGGRGRGSSAGGRSEGGRGGHRRF
ncbi:MAG: RNA-binding protein [Acidobacteriota bacterium]